MKEMESIMKHQDTKDTASDDDFEDGSSSDLDFGEFCNIFYFPDLDS